MTPNNLSFSLNTLLAPWLTLSDDQGVSITGMTLDSRAVQSGDLFVALQGAQLDGRRFITNAIQSGAHAVLSHTLNAAQHGQTELCEGTLVIHVYDLPTMLSALAQRFYFNALHCHKVIGITGTNGKTTIATLLANAFTLLNQCSAQMGTIGNGLFGQLQSSLNTTLDPISVFACLYDYQRQGVQYSMMEVSSHGLVQGRVSALPFYSAIFTNLSRDHLDYHGTMAAYGDAKKKLFTDFPVAQRIINVDDPLGEAWLSEYSDAVSYSASAKKTDTHRYLSVDKVTYQAQGLRFEFDSSWGRGVISAPFYGDFNVANLAAVISQLLLENVTIDNIQQIIPQLDSVAGRMEQYHFSEQRATFVVDYAHTPDALQKALVALTKHSKSGRLICVFGCGGDRDKGKRAEMAKVAEAFADKVVLVDDNPRTESAEQIMQDILTGFAHPQHVQCIHDRKTAILNLLENSAPGDLVLVAGKGHEDYQIIGDKRIDYSDRALLAQLQMNKKKKTDL